MPRLLYACRNSKGQLELLATRSDRCPSCGRSIDCTEGHLTRATPLKFYAPHSAGLLKDQKYLFAAADGLTSILTGRVATLGALFLCVGAETKPSTGPQHHKLAAPTILIRMILAVAFN